MTLYVYITETVMLSFWGNWLLLKWSNDNFLHSLWWKFPRNDISCFVDGNLCTGETIFLYWGIFIFIRGILYSDGHQVTRKFMVFPGIISGPDT